MTILHPPIDPPIHGRGLSLSFAEVEERLVQAMLVYWRQPDAERGWLRLRAHWPDVSAEAGDYDARGGDLRSSDVVLRPASLTRAETAAAGEAFGWLDVVPPADRKLIGLAITALARGESRVPWLRLLRPMGMAHGSEGLRKRYGRAMRRVVIAANAAIDPQKTAESFVRTCQAPKAPDEK